jgi:6-phosphogluconate dehydrogenase
MLAGAMSLPFYDGDDFHPEANIEKMRMGIPLEDADRYAWLQRLHGHAIDLSKHNGGVIACSALKESYRELLMDGIAQQVKWILLDGEYDLIKTRMQQRTGHYMPVDLLNSQFDALEIPPYAIRISIDQTPEAIVEQIMESLTKNEMGIVGLGVMGRALALNFADKGVSLSLYNRHVAGKEEHVARDYIAAHDILQNANGFDNLPAFVESLQTPRKILLMVEAGNAVDALIEHLCPLLSPGDVIADCGNSHYTDTKRRIDHLAKQNLYFLGVGISGGEEGARRGPSIMPGGSKEGYVLFQPLLEGIAARDKQNNPCCNYIGNDGAGHFVKMVHNGIEYAEMQLIAELYGTLRHGYGYHPDAIAELFEQWKTDIHQSFLLEITAQILRKREDDSWFLDNISDASQSKGTGGWTLQAANELAIASPMIAAAVHARFLFGDAEGRAQAFKVYQGRIDDSCLPQGMPLAPAGTACLPAGTARFNDAQPHLDEGGLGDAYYLARLINHHLGFELLRAASKAYDWNLDLQEISRIWSQGCIIRSLLMESLYDILPTPILVHQEVYPQVEAMRSALIDFVVSGASHCTHMPCHSAALNFLNGFIADQPTGNLIQAQRDFFGAHGFQRTDDPFGKMYHF